MSLAAKYSLPPRLKTCTLQKLLPPTSIGWPTSTSYSFWVSRTRTPPGSTAHAVLVGRDGYRTTRRTVTNCVSDTTPTSFVAVTRAA